MKTLCELFNTVRHGMGDTLQNGVLPGPKRLGQFIQAIHLQETPKLYAQDGKGKEAIAYVKIFDPCGSWTWFITEFNPQTNEAFGLVHGHEKELGYIDLESLAKVKGPRGIGVELDMHWTPRKLSEL